VSISRSFLLFNELLLWHTRIPPELQFNDSKLVEQCWMRCAGIWPEPNVFLMAVMQTKNMIRRSVGKYRQRSLATVG